MKKTVNTGRGKESMHEVESKGDTGDYAGPTGFGGSVEFPNFGGIENHVATSDSKESCDSAGQADFDFSLSLAIFDSVPVLLFGASTVILGSILNSILFIAGAVLCFASGSAKVIWKLMIALKKENIRLLSAQMRFAMPVGFTMMILGGIIHRNDETAQFIIKSAFEMPVLPFVLAGILSFVLMGVFAVTMDSSKSRTNRIEEITNTIGQSAFLIAIIMLAYASGYSHADADSVQALKSTDNVRVEVTEDRAVFLPEKKSETGLVFYPGGKVEFTAYAPLLSELAEEGITGIVVRMPLQLAFFDINSAEKVKADYPQIKKWYIAGHSLGGVAASEYARKNAESLEGIILLAAYPPEPLDGIRVLSVYGSEDGILNMDEYRKARSNFPEDVTEVVITGGNHSQFGSYGEQDGDGNAEIDSREQWRLTEDAILRFMKENDSEK